MKIGPHLKNNCHWWGKFTRNMLFWDLFYYGKQKFFCNLSCNHTIHIVIKVEISWFFNWLEMAEIFSTFYIPFCSKKLNMLCYKLQCTVFHLSSTQLWKKSHSCMQMTLFMALSKLYIPSTIPYARHYNPLLIIDHGF